ncbi:unnamed protein product [Urochloa humidicola]
MEHLQSLDTSILFVYGEDGFAVCAQLCLPKALASLRSFKICLTLAYLLGTRVNFILLDYASSLASALLQGARAQALKGCFGTCSDLRFCSSGKAQEVL